MFSVLFFSGIFLEETGNVYKMVLLLVKLCVSHCGLHFLATVLQVWRDVSEVPIFKT